jgi:phosphoribosylformylglycinamidine cyclo-ligase
VAERTTYAAAGVDVAAGDQAVELIAEAVRSTWAEAGVVGPFGGFAGSIALPKGLRDPVLVSSSDGVGTKTAIAAALGRYDTIGADLVAMVVDDLVCAGARPLFMQDYLAVGRLDPEREATIVAGVAAGCREVGIALVGGETAEHPGLMASDAFDLAGFGVGVVERHQLIDGSTIREGDAIIGISASGLHANGFSLVRALLDDGRLPLTDELLTPTRIYAPVILALRRALREEGHDIGGLAHITGGGLPGNVPRALPAGLAAMIDPTRWDIPRLQRRIADAAGIDDRELRATFNTGIGMVVIVPRGAVPIVESAIDGVVIIGSVVSADAADPGRYVESALP